MKKVVALFLSLLMVLMLLPTIAFADSTITLSATTNGKSLNSLVAGDVVTVTMTIPQISTRNISFELKFDSSVFSYNDDTSVEAFTAAGFNVAKMAVSGSNANVARFNAAAFSGTTTIPANTQLKANFTVKQDVEKSAKFALGTLKVDAGVDVSLSTEEINVEAIVIRPATGIKLNKTSLSLSLNGTKEETLVATVEPSNTTDTVTWTSSNTKVATVVNGKVTAVGAGTAVITVRAGNQTATCTVNVSECDHVFTAETVKAEALKTAGDCLNKAVYYKSCAKCGAVSSNDSDTFEGAFGSHKMTKHEATVATCAKEGNPEYWSCSVCKKNYDSATGGTEVTNIVIQKDPANHVGGYKYEVNKTDATKHDKICTGCDTVVETVAHSGGTPTCTKKAVCSDCKAEYGELAKHKLTKTEKVDSTCTATGHQAYWTCSECKGIFADDQGATATTLDKLTIAKKAHTPGDYVTNATEHFKTCSVCGIEIKDSRAKHTFVKDEATGVETCSVCGYAIGGKVDENHQHAADKEAGLFRDENNHWYKCTDKNCTSHVGEAKHDFETVSTTKDGNKTTTVEKCKTCQYVKTTTVDNTPVTPVNPGKPGRPSGTKTVQSGKTFDAGVGVYVGLSILSLTGSAVVIGKKRKDR